MIELLALSILQPWAWAITAGFKPLENRGWSPPRRGWFAVHAGKSMKHLRADVIELRHQLDAAQLSSVAVPQDFVHGRIIAVAHLADVFTVNTVPARMKPWFMGPLAFHLDRVVMLTRPIEAKGALNFWRVGERETAAVNAQLSDSLGKPGWELLGRK